MTDQEMLFIYALMNSMPDKTPEKRFAAAKSLAEMMGIDLFGQPEQVASYVSENIPPPDIGVVEKTYGQDAGWKHVFAAIRDGLTPEQAIADAEATGYKFAKPDAYGKYQGADPFQIASDYSKEFYDLSLARAEYDAKEKQARSQYDAEQAARPPSASDMFSTAADRYRQQTGRDMTVQTLMEDYRKALNPAGIGSAAAAGPAGPRGVVSMPATKDPLQFSIVPERQKAFQQAFERKLGGVVERAQQTPTAEGEQMLRQLAMMAALRGGL